MMHPATELRFIDEEIGYGVVATEDIPKGTITWVQDELDQIFTPAQVSAMGKPAQEMINKYSFRNNKGNFVLCWDLSKYVNHSFRSNCLSTAYDFEIAVRDIAAGEELTDDYGYLNVTEAFLPRDEHSLRKAVYPDDLLHYHEDWDQQLEEAFRELDQVQQPLKKLLSRALQKKIDLILTGKEKMDSILNLYYRENS